ncbi:DUF305 domain-containing protein [Nostocoides sp. Soil756]|uniref:DUF305 domain-containing protein n=1 Tax=Nostocoides sp. Soil756 TaxID=1736399 RepID=UPI00070235E4|nr:DUF305 domain-containing protein [Tetrasphaera sp. Soil756]KRE60107.1 hypothetical protein ASG78_15475 [Tetrasphaera sp. Soil756]
MALKTLAVSLTLAAVALTACSGTVSDGAASSSASTSSLSATTSATFNDADVSFATDMISHHRQAVEMAELADTRAKRQEVKALATQIKDAQGPEIKTMSAWLTAWGRPVPADMSGMDMSGSMPGMMSTADMASLSKASGADFDTRFLTMMVAHHEGAIEMARTEISDGADADAVALAGQIEKAQTAEIATMKKLLSS